jgi:energy-coupling factor transporter ATP-binding protein EcfA2
MKLKLALENCYGINQLNKEFDFTKSDSNDGVNSLYAPNGTLKTSLAKTFIDVVNEDETKDLIFPDRETKRDITIDNVAITPEQIMVIESYNESYSSKQLSTLLVNDTLKQQYDTALKEVDEKRTALVKTIAKPAGKKGVAISAFPKLICEIFGRPEKAFLELLAELHQETLPDYSSYAAYKFVDLFNDKVLAVIAKGDFAKELSDYVDTYDKLIDQSTVLTKSFNHQKAGTISKSLGDADFFKAKHSVNISVDGKPQLAENLDQLNAILQAEQDKVLNSDDLKQQFAKIDDKLKTKDTAAFRDFITENQTLLADYQDIPQFKKTVIKSYLQAHQSLWDDLVTIYQNNQAVVEGIIQQAKAEQTTWAAVVDTFNERFTVPFKLSVNNQDDVILNNQAPTIQFEFNDGRGAPEIVNQESLIEALSQGEKRALYILNVLFEVEVKKQQSVATIIVIDDIADSFDYKNKYAIVEYLQDIAGIDIFHLFSLTHNFDFHRIISSRVGVKRKNRLMATRCVDTTDISQERYQNDVFSAWKQELAGNVGYLLASIPFARNIADYCGHEAHYTTLTSLLHIKPDTSDIKVSHLESIYKDIFADQQGLALPNQENVLKDMIYAKSEELLQGNTDAIELENKVILAIAIRLKAEEFMISKINDSVFVLGITKDQTRKLFNKYCDLFSNELTTKALLDQVNLMTPENIHLNSFMYEPILDMSAHRLYQLYAEIKQLSDTE